jgi:hypothetical protein
VFGNVLDPDSEIRWVLENKRVFVLKEELGTARASSTSSTSEEAPSRQPGRRPPPPHVPPLSWRRVLDRPPTAPGLFYAWMFVLTAVALVGANTWAWQVRDGMAVTGMSDHVSWGLYIANFTFLVGLAAGGVMMVIPAYLYHDEDMHDVVIIGELLAVAAIVMASLRRRRPRPARPLLAHAAGPRAFNWPVSMLTWDVIVLNGYLAHQPPRVRLPLYKRYLGQRPEPAVVRALRLPLHRVGHLHPHGHRLPLLRPRRPPLLEHRAPRPALPRQRLRHRPRVHRAHAPARALFHLRFASPRGRSSAALDPPRVTVLINLFMLGSELFTHLLHRRRTTPLRRATSSSGSTATTSSSPGSGPPSRSTSAPRRPPHARAPPHRAIVLNTALVATFVGVWIEKGMGLIVPGFIPSTLHEIVPYAPPSPSGR